MPAPHDGHARLRARRAALARHAHGDTRTATEPARRAWEERWVDEVDPNRQLDPDERARRAERAKRAHMLGLAQRSAEARRRRRR